MNRSWLTAQRLVGLFLLGCVLFNYPVLYLFNHPVRVMGIPLLYLYVFVAWGVLVALMAWVIERRGE